MLLNYVTNVCWRKDTLLRETILMSQVRICMKICPVQFYIWDGLWSVLNGQGTERGGGGDSWQGFKIFFILKICG
jgi:hypothetical protein